MKSAVTGKEMRLMKEMRTISFRKENFEVVFQYYLCVESNEQFTSTDLDEVNYNQVYNQFREKHNIPFPEEIKYIRETYSLSLAKMSEIMGFGANTYRNYESGEVPSTPNARLIDAAKNPTEFKRLVSLCDSLDDKTKIKILKKVESVIEEEQKHTSSKILTNHFVGEAVANIHTGYRIPNYIRFSEMVSFFSEKLEPFKTKMNKLLFYADFVMFRDYGHGISGLQYKAIDRGPVPNRFQSLFEDIAINGKITISAIQFPNYIGEQFKANPQNPFNKDLFTENEIATLEKIVEKFKDSTTNDIVDISHQELAWLENEKEKNIISYRYAFDLKAI